MLVGASVAPSIHERGDTDSSCHVDVNKDFAHSLTHYCLSHSIIIMCDVNIFNDTTVKQTLIV